MLDFSRIYDIKTVVFRRSFMFGGRQFATYDQGWLEWFIQKAIEIKQNRLKNTFAILGNGKKVRDLLNVSDYVSLYLQASEKIQYKRAGF